MAVVNDLRVVLDTVWLVRRVWRWGMASVCGNDGGAALIDLCRSSAGRETHCERSESRGGMVVWDGVMDADGSRAC